VCSVRAAYPAALSAGELSILPAGSGRRADVGIPRFDGSAITVALLDTGVDFTHPYIRDRLLDGLDMLDPERRAIARAHPDEPTRLERHGTQMAGLIAGRGGPGGIHGVVPASRILPIRIAGWQPSAEGGFAIYGRTDQLLWDRARR
jgi:subtilisin family serine protease